MNRPSLLPSRRGPIYTPEPSLKTWPFAAAGVGGLVLLVATGGGLAFYLRTPGSPEAHASRAPEFPAVENPTSRTDWGDAPRTEPETRSRPTLKGEGIRLLELPVPPVPGDAERPLAVGDERGNQPRADVVLTQRTEAELHEQLARVPQFTLLESNAVAATMKSYGTVLGWYGGTPSDVGRNPLVEAEVNKQVQAMLAEMRKTGLPLQAAQRAQLDARSALVLEAISRQMRAGKAERFGPGMNRVLTLAVPGGTLGEELSGPKVRQMLRNWDQLHVQKDFNIVPTLAQMLPVEDEESRGILIEELARSSRPDADVALAQRALYELSPKLRQAAVQALKGRDPAQVRHVLLEGMRYPWSPVAEHAAEALVELKDRAAVPKLIELLEAGDPAAPAYNEKSNRYEVRELVRVNHLGSCYLCHAPSYSVTDPARGRDLLTETSHAYRVTDPVQTLNVTVGGGRRIGCKPPPPPQATVVVTVNQPREIKFTTSSYVRADTTYLRQDFSVMQKVEKPRRESPRERFDFLVRSREVPLDSVPEHVVRRQAVKTEAAEPLDRRGQARTARRELVVATEKRRGNAQDEVKGTAKSPGRPRMEAVLGESKPGRNLDLAVGPVGIVKSLPLDELVLDASQPRGDYPQRAAILHALTRLTGSNVGDHPAAWRNWLQSSGTSR